MSGDIARSFLDSIRGFTQDDGGETPSQNKPVKLGVIDALYASGNPKVLFDGETIMGIRGYPWSGRQPRAGDRVVLLPQGHSYVIIGSLGDFPGAELPTGTMLEGLWAAAPVGFVLLDGTVLTRTLYPALFTLIGVGYNTGGETAAQFRVPNFQGRTLVQKNVGTFGTLGGTLGTENEVLTIAQMPSHGHVQDPHNHTQNAHGHTFTDSGGFTPGVHDLNVAAGTVGHYWRGAPAVFSIGATTATNVATTATNQPTGGGTAHNNIQPSAVVNRALRY